MILPLGAIFPDTRYPLPNLYGIAYGVGGSATPKQPAASISPPVRTEIRDIVTLSLAAQRLIDQAERLKQME